MAKKYNVPKTTNPDLDNLILNCPKKIPQYTSNLQEERTCAQESKMGNVHGHYHQGHHHGHHSVGQAPVGHPSGHHSVGQAAGPAETEVAFNNYMERVIGTITYSSPRLVVDWMEELFVWLLLVENEWPQMRFEPFSRS